MELEALQKMASADLVIRKDQIDSETNRTAQVHSKYLKMWLDELKTLRRMERNFKSLWLQQTQYYLGKADPEVYKEKPFDLKVKPIKTELTQYLDADPDIQAEQEKVVDQEIIVKFLRETLDMIGQRGFQIRDNIEWRKLGFGEMSKFGKD